MARAGELGVERTLTFLREVDDINMQRRSRVVELVREELGGSVLGARVAVLGAAFKPHTDDVRDSPALNVAAQLHLLGAQVQVYDPVATANARAAFPTLTYADDLIAAVTGADLVLHATEWPEFTELDPDHVRDLVARPILVDARNRLNAQRWHRAGWTIRGIGRPRLTALPRPEVQQFGFAVAAAG